MIEIKGMDEDTLWDIASLCYRHLECEEEYADGDRERFQEGHRRRADYLRRMLFEGARLQVAYRKASRLGSSTTTRSR
jgi:hypothetical protein